ncbi:MAG: hypothetical protein J1F64_05960 [Oscillospiraceae bacterium]|nr:hypothetical protein [Oscillospiraceae bacterium]
MPETYGENKSRDAMRFYTIEEKWKMLEDYERSKEKESNPPPANSPGQTGKEEPIPESNRDNQSETTSIVPCDNTVRQQSNDIVPYMGRQIVPYTNTQTDIFRNYPTILNPEDIFSPTPSNDTGNADFLMRLFGDKLIYVEKYGFLYWNGKIWKMCSDKKLKKYVIEEMKCRDIYYKENSDYDVDDAFSKQSGNNNRIDAAIELLKAKLYIDSELLDSAKHILCVRNGVIDFETQTLNPHSMYKDCYLTKMADVDYYDYHIDNTWQSFINSITSGDREKAAYLQKAFGAAVIGNPKEQKVHILLGNGSNGKSTLLNAIRNTLTSEYVCEMPITVITGSDNPDANAANPAIAALEGKLIAIASEVGSGAVLNEAKLKKLCGGGTISARKLRQNTHEFEPTFSIFIDTNCLPKVKNASSAEAFSVFRRFAIIPFNNTFDANRDTSLGDRLKTESTKTAILTWLIQGAFEYMNNPCLTPTQEMKDALGRYKMTENTVGGFIGDCIDITDNPNDFISSADLYNRYCEYCEEKGASPVNKDTFSKYGDLKNYKGRNSKSRGYKGIRLLDK